MFIPLDGALLAKALKFISAVDCFDRFRNITVCMQQHDKVTTCFANTFSQQFKEICTKVDKVQNQL